MSANSTPISNRDSQYTVAVAEEAMDRIKALGLPADPTGFALWYNYVTGANEELNRRLNRLIEENGAISAEQLEQIENEFGPAAHTLDAVGSVGSKISAEIDHVIGMLSELIVSTAQGRDDCADASRRLAHSDDRDAIAAISDTLIDLLRGIEVRHTALEKRFAAAKVEIEAVREALVQVTAQAHLDSVTGLVNRRGFDSALAKAIEIANASHRPLSLLLIDIDDFKVFNDRYGHLMGDTVLRLIAVALKQCIKGRDIAARYGGDELSVILPDTDLKGAVTLAEQIRTKIVGRTLKKHSTGDSLGTVKVSIGAATLRRGDRLRHLVERADACLYEAKHSGRNCTRFEHAFANTQMNYAQTT